MENTLSDLSQAKKLIDSLDLNLVMKRSIRIDKWPKKQVIEVCTQYKNYLFLKKKYGNTYELPPSADIDEVWHAHILHTQDYYEFCKKVFSGFLHHHPHHGRENNISQQKLELMFETQTQRLYKQEFGEYLYAVRPIPFKLKISKVIKKLIF